MSTAASVLNEHWDGRLPVDPVRIARGMGIEVRGSGVFTPAIQESGRIELVDGKPVITFNMSDAIVRRRFTVAHEIGHYALGHLSGATTLYRDTAVNFSSSSYSPEERQANAFAAQLLMPANTLRYAVEQRGVANVADLARMFGVSQAAMGYRLSNIGLVNA